MSLHVFANLVTPFGTAANNRGDNQGDNITPLQKLIWYGEPHTTVSAEAIRFAIRRRLKAMGLECNRHWAEHLSDIPEKVREQLAKAYKGEIKVPCGYFLDPDFAWYSNRQATGYADDDILGFMSAEAPKGEGESGSANVRRAVLEVTRAVSLTPWTGDATFNAASSGATPSAQKKGSNPVPYGTEVHATRYQYGIALTPERLRDRSRAAKAIEALCHLGTVAGNHGRFLFDFSPDAVVFRITSDPAPRLLYCFDTPDDGKTVIAPRLEARVAAGDIDAKELVVAGVKIAGIDTEKGVKAACTKAVKLITTALESRG
jgi:CRISPR-associated protein Cst2